MTADRTKPGTHVWTSTGLCYFAYEVGENGSPVVVGDKVAVASGKTEREARDKLEMLLAELKKDRDAPLHDRQ